MLSEFASLLQFGCHMRRPKVGASLGDMNAVSLIKRQYCAANTYSSSQTRRPQPPIRQAAGKPLLISKYAQWIPHYLSQLPVLLPWLCTS